MKRYLHILSFLNIEMVGVIEIFLMEGKKTH